MSIQTVTAKIEPAIALLIFAQSLTGVGGIAAKDALLVMDTVAKALGQPLPSLTADEAQVHIDRLRASFSADDAVADELVDEHA